MLRQKAVKLALFFVYKQRKNAVVNLARVFVKISFYSISKLFVRRIKGKLEHIKLSA